MLTVGVAATSIGAAASSVGHRQSAKSTTVAPDYKYFRGKTITLVADGAAGGATDVQYRAVAPVLAVLLHCNVVVQDDPTGAGISSQDDVYASKPNGLTIGSFSGDQDVTDQAEKIAGVNFPLKKVIQLGGAGQPESLIVSSSSGPSTIQQFLTTTTPTKVLQTTGSSFSIVVNMLIAAYHDVPAQVVYGYSSSANLVQGFERGDGPVMGTAEHPMQSLLQAGVARPLLLSVKPWPTMPLYQQLRSI
ncbi:MAG TPA: hypothetical protein VGS21_07155, partial [Acidimicrobiales bacterium]|nr:hypothetical protein [Acidimicrobiales bacterium]